MRTRFVLAGVIVLLVALGAGCTGVEPTTDDTATPTVSSTATSATDDATATTDPGATPSSGPTPGTAPAGSTWTVEVVRVVDGDTLEVRFEEGYTEDVRLLGVDTPEVHRENDPAAWPGVPDSPAGHEWLRDWAHRASESVRQTVGGETVRIETDPAADRRGGFGRLLVYVYHDDELLNHALLSQGYAKVYPSTFSRRDAFEATEEHARRNDVGVWGFDAADHPTATVRPDGGDERIRVAAMQADAPGNDHENPNGEYVVFENPTDEPIDLSGYTISDETDHTYRVPDGFVLGAGAEVTLYTGAGDDGGDELYWGRDRAVWNNDGDTVSVTDDTGRTVLEYSY